MKADQIIRNAKIYTADKNQPMAAAFAVKDGKFVYVGDKAGLAAYEGSITVGKDADFLVFDNDLLTADPEGISCNKPRDVYFCGKKMK